MPTQQDPTERRSAIPDREPGISGEPEAILARLRKLRSHARASLLVSGLAWITAFAVGCIVLGASLDFVLRMPAWLRGALLTAGVGAALVAVLRWVLPAWRFRPDLTELALRVERLPEAREAGLSGVLASGLELAHAPAEGQTTRWMSGRVVGEASRRFQAIAGAALLRRDRNIATLLILGAAVIAIALTTWTAGPKLTRIGVARVLAPWSGAEWPKRTEVADATALDVHPLGTALPLRAALLKSQAGVDGSRVAARYRLLEDGRPGPLQRVFLQPQHRKIEVMSTGGGASGELFEQLIGPGALVSADPARADTGSLALEYWFETSDDQTDPRAVRLVEPPAVVGATAEISPPAYADSGDTRRFVRGTHDLGPGDDQRAIVGPVLAGSRARLTIRFNKSIPGPESVDDRLVWLAGVAPGAAFGPDLEVAASESEWSLSWTLRTSTRIPVIPRDEFGLAGRDDTAFAFDVIEDRPPTAAVTLPAQDEAVLATALIDSEGEGRDDVGIESVRLEAQTARRPGGSLGASPEPVGEPSVVSTTKPETGDATQVQAVGRISLSAFALKPGDELWITALAADGYELDGERHEPVRSAPRKLRIVTEEELIEQVRTDLAGIREAAIRLDQDQAELIEATRRGFVSDDERRRQGGLAPRLEQQTDLAQRLLERAERNALDDAALRGLLQDVRELLDAAQRGAEQAGSRLDEAAQNSPSPEHTELTPEQAANVQRAQNEARDNLGKLIEMLDRGEDSWATRRELQRLLERQRDLEARTAAAGQRTVGQDPENLSPQDQQELARISEEQARLAEQARAALDNLSQRAKQMREIDAAQSAAMNRAAQRGQQQQVPERMERAAEETGRNQTGSAREQQQEAMQAMEEMLDDLENADRNRDESLRRLLSSLIESLDGLIAQQELELAALGAARLGNRPMDGLDQGMIRLNQNTLGVLGEAKAAFREMAKVSALITQASEAQASAIGALREVPVDDEGAETDEQASLRDLRLARQEAQRIQDEASKRDQDRKRQELRRVYRDALEQQVVLRDETAPLLGRQPDRRERLKLRGLGERQDTLRQTLDDLRRRTAELEDAALFAFAHDQLNLVMGSAAKALRSGQPSAGIKRDQDSAVRILRSLVEALAETPNQNDEFRDSETGGGGGGGEGGPPPLIPELAELRLLRGMQQQAAELTRALDESPDTATPSDFDALTRLQEDLAEEGQSLIERLQRPDEPAPAPPGGDRP